MERYRCAAALVATLCAGASVPANIRAERAADQVSVRTLARSSFVAFNRNPTRVDQSVDSEPFFMTRLATEQDIAEVSAADLDVWRNEIFARHGRRFKNSSLQNVFERQPWYVGRHDADDFDESVLTLEQRRNVAFFLLAAERARQRSEPSPPRPSKITLDDFANEELVVTATKIKVPRSIVAGLREELALESAEFKDSPGLADMLATDENFAAGLDAKVMPLVVPGTSLTDEPLYILLIPQHHAWCGAGGTCEIYLYGIFEDGIVRQEFDAPQSSINSVRVLGTSHRGLKDVCVLDASGGVRSFALMEYDGQRYVAKGLGERSCFR